MDVWVQSGVVLPLSEFEIGADEVFGQESGCLAAVLGYFLGFLGFVGLMFIVFLGCSQFQMDIDSEKRKKRVEKPFVKRSGLDFGFRVRN